MDYVISPWFFYWLGVVDYVSIMFGVFGWICLFSFFITLSFYIYFNGSSIYGYYHYPEYEKKEDKKIEYQKQQALILKFWVKLTLIISIPLIMFSIAIPSKNTLILMAVAKNITYSNIGKAKEEIAKDGKAIVDYMFEKVNGTIKEVKK